MKNSISTFYGIPVTELNKDIKSGKYILKAQGNINGNINAQTVVVYGNVNGSIKANEVVVINGNPTGPITADNIVGLKKSEEQEKTCKSCKYYTEENCIPSLFYCKQKKSGFVKKDIKICEEYQEEKKSCNTCKYHKRLSEYQHFYSCNCDSSTKEIKCEKYQKKENPAKQVSSPKIPIKNQY